MGLRVWRVARPAAMSRAHTHADVEMNWVGSGRVEYVLAGRACAVEENQLGIFWGGMPHQLLLREPAPSGIWFTLPLSWFLQCDFANGFASRLMKGQMCTVSVLPQQANQWLEDFEAGAARRRLLLLELEAQLGRLAMKQPRQRRMAEKRAASARTDGGPIEEVTAYLAANYREAVSVVGLAERVGLHPKYLMALFRRQCGMTIKSYLLRLRLAHAQRLLATSELRILDVALESGFGSLSRFYEAFTEHIGERPLRYRKRQMGR